jgi:hypothetical protein
MPRLSRESGAYAVHSRVSELRKRGHRIEQRSTRLADGTIASEYRLEPEDKPTLYTEPKSDIVPPSA